MNQFIIVLVLVVGAFTAVYAGVAVVDSNDWVDANMTVTGGLTFDDIEMLNDIGVSAVQDTDQSTRN